MSPTAVVSIEGEFTVLNDDWEVEIQKAMLLAEEYEDHERRLRAFERDRAAYKAWPNGPKAEPVPEVSPSEDMSKPWAYHPEGCACRACVERFGAVVGVQHVEGCCCGACASARRRRAAPLEVVMWREAGFMKTEALGPVALVERVPRGGPDGALEEAPPGRDTQPVKPSKNGDGIYEHEGGCGCEWCEDEVPPRYARAYRGERRTRHG
jgi:hypothetical protein